MCGNNKTLSCHSHSLSRECCHSIIGHHKHIHNPLPPFPQPPSSPHPHSPPRDTQCAYRWIEYFLSHCSSYLNAIKWNYLISKHEKKKTYLSSEHSRHRIFLLDWKKNLLVFLTMMCSPISVTPWVLHWFSHSWTIWYLVMRYISKSCSLFP